MIHKANENLSWGDLWSVEEAAETFDAILNVGRDVKDHPLPGTEYKMKYFLDQDPFPCEDIWECVLWIDEKIKDGKNVYVHCHQGNSRSASTIIAYLHHIRYGLWGGLWSYRQDQAELYKFWWMGWCTHAS